MKRSAERGYTLVELMSTIGIVALLSALIVANTRVGDRHQQLRDAAGTYINALRLAEAYATSGHPVNGTGRAAYGVCITSAGAPGCTPPSGPANTFRVYARTLAQTDAAGGSGPAMAATPPAGADILANYELPQNVVFAAASLATYVDFLAPVGHMYVSTTTAAASRNDATVTLRYSTSDPYSKSILISPRAGGARVQ